MICRQPTRRPSAGSRPVQSRVPRSGFERRYAAIASFASSLNDASTAREEEAASTLTLLPKQRGREQAGGCQLLRFVAFLRGQSDILGSRSLVAGPCRIHASPRPSNLRSTDADHPTSPGTCQERSLRVRGPAYSPLVAAAPVAPESTARRCQIPVGAALWSEFGWFRAVEEPGRPDSCTSRADGTSGFPVLAPRPTIRPPRLEFGRTSGPACRR